MAEDSYLTIAAPAEAASRERSSKFLAYAYPVRTEEEVRKRLDALRKRYYDATHHCYAWRLGPHGEQFRSNDDGEPSGTAGKPILGQLLSTSVTDCLVVVVRSFGGTQLGRPGLIAASFPSVAMNDIMRFIKELQPTVRAQRFDNLCTMELTIRETLAGQLVEKLRKAGGSIREEGQQGSNAE